PSQPLFVPAHFPPLQKGDYRGISKISPSPSFIKRGVVIRIYKREDCEEIYKVGSSVAELIKKGKTYK
ncbi:MAG TPA: hypothetical protein PLP13_07120, partial [bacterium]|nr:hypothetical protein [bacterium]